MFDALIDDQIADFGETINVCLARTKIAAFDRVVEQSVNAVAVVLIIFRGVDSALRRDRMGATRRILITKTFHPITEFAEGRCSGTAGETAADNDDLELAPIIRTDQSRMIAMALPFPVERTGRNFGVQCSDHMTEQKSKLESRNPKQTSENSNTETNTRPR